MVRLFPCSRAELPLFFFFPDIVLVSFLVHALSVGLKRQMYAYKLFRADQGHLIVYLQGTGGFRA